MASFLEGIEVLPPKMPDSPQRPKQLESFDRLVIQNIFDNNPKKKALYLKKLGFELDPKDENKYRPIGNVGSYANIDPGFSEAFRKGGLSAVVNEAGLDIGDVAYDWGLANLAATGGGAAGVAAGVPAGPVGVMAGLVLGGAAGNAAAETFKNELGNWIVDQDFPLDKRQTLIQSMIVGATPAIFRLGRKASLPLVKGEIETRKIAIANAIKTAGEKGAPISDGVIERAAREPEMFTEDAVKGATSRINDIYRHIFGLEEAHQVTRPKSIKEGLFREKINPWNGAADAEVDRLALMPEASFSAEEVKAPFLKKIQEITNPDPTKGNFFPEEEQLRAIEYIEKKIFPMVDAAAAKGEGRLNFKQARNLADKVQADAFDKNIEGGAMLRQLVGDDPEGYLKLIDNRVKDISSLPSIKAKQHEIMNAYNGAVKTINKNTILNGFIGNENITKEEFAENVLNMDKALGTNYYQLIESGQFQRAIEGAFKNKDKFGARPAVSQALVSGAKGAVGGGVGGAVVGSTLPGAGTMAGAGIGATVGALEGARTGLALRSPKAALEGLQDATQKVDNIDQILADVLGKPLSMGGQTAALETGEALAPSLTPAEQPSARPSPMPQAPATPSFLEGIEIEGNE